MKKGDVIAVVAKPIAKGLDRFLYTNWSNCNGCNQMQNNLNAGMSLADAFFDRFWPKTNEEQKNK